MAVILQAPFGAITDVVTLPNPKWQNAESCLHNITMKRTMNGSKFTYVKDTDVYALKFEFSMSRQISINLKTFIIGNHQKRMLLIDWLDQPWLVILKNNPLELLIQAHDNECFAEVDVGLEFEGRKL